MDPSDDKTKSEHTRKITKPAWYEVLMKKNFREKCSIHPNLRRDVFCFFCYSVVCCDCVISHHSCPLVQVTNRLDDDAVWLDYMSNFIDCSEIQTHEIEGEKLIKLKPKHEMKSAEECKKVTKNSFKFCSFSCKVEHVLDQEEDLSSICRFERFRTESLKVDQTIPNYNSNLHDKEFSSICRLLAPPSIKLVSRP